MNIKNKIKSEKGSMTAYVTIVLLSMVIILVSLFLITNSERREQLSTIMRVKETYEADNNRAVEIYEYLISK